MSHAGDTCSGRWVAGSGGHRKHEPCARPATYWHPEDAYCYCDKHVPTHEARDYYHTPEAAGIEVES